MKIKKKYKFLIILLTLLIGPRPALGQEALVSNQKMTINAKAIDLTGYNIGGHNYYKLRDLAQVLGGQGFDFNLEGDARVIKAYLGQAYDHQGHSFTRPQENKQALAKSMDLIVYSGGTQASHQVQVYNIDDYNYFKLRDIGQILDFGVDYNKPTRQVKILTKQGGKPADPDKKGQVVLGNERILGPYKNLLKGKNVGLITNQTGIDSQGIRTVEKFYKDPDIDLLALYSPEHGLDGKTKAGAWVQSYQDQEFGLPVYSLYGQTRKPSPAMLKDIDVLVFDIQDIGSRTYTYISCMHYCMQASKENKIDFIVLDRPNPIGDKVEGFMLEDKYRTYVGVDLMPMSHGMTIGELAQYFNRNIGARLKVVPMENYKRSMIWQETGLKFAQTSPNIPNIESAFNYMATGSGEGTGAFQGSQFAWVGSKGLDSKDLARRLNSSQLIQGVSFIPETRGENGGVRLEITDYKLYNPARVGYVALGTINQMVDLTIPREENGTIPMFEKIQGSDKMGDMLLRKLSPEAIVAAYQKDIEEFKNIRRPYLLYD